MSSTISYMYECYYLSQSIIGYITLNMIVFSFNFVTSAYYAGFLVFPIAGVVASLNYSTNGLQVYSLFLGLHSALPIIGCIREGKTWQYIWCGSALYGSLVNAALICKLDSRLKQLPEKKRVLLIQEWSPQSQCTSWGDHELHTPLCSRQFDMSADEQPYAHDDVF